METFELTALLGYARYTHLMKRTIFPFLTVLALALPVFAAPRIDEKKFGDSLGGWKKNKTVSYELSGSDYRTYKPEITPTPDGGLFVSLRIDHLRGMLSSNDHAVLEITIGKDGSIVSAQSNLALQGLSISSDMIRGGANASANVVGIGAAVKVGTDLAADLSSKLLREKIVEAGRVSYPAALRHNYNLLIQSIVTESGAPAPAATEVKKATEAEAKTTEPAKPAEPSKPVEAKAPAEAAKPAEQPANPAEAVPPANGETKPTSAPKLEVKAFGETKPIEEKK